MTQRPTLAAATPARTRSFTFVAWHDPVIEAHPEAFPTASDYAIDTWAHRLGPTAVLLAHLAARNAATGPSTWTLHDLAHHLGVGDHTQRIPAALERLTHAGFIRTTGTTVRVRLAVLTPPRSRRPAHLRAVTPPQERHP